MHPRLELELVTRMPIVLFIYLLISMENKQRYLTYILNELYNRKPIVRFHDARHRAYPPEA